MPKLRVRQRRHPRPWRLRTTRRELDVWMPGWLAKQVAYWRWLQAQALSKN